MRVDEMLDGDVGSLMEWGHRGRGDGRSGAPGWGTGFRGFGQALFGRGHYGQIGEMINREHENAGAKKALVDWFTKCFHADRPDRSEESIRRVIENGHGGRPRWQERHFYHLAHMVKETESRDLAEYICHWLSDFFYNEGSAGHNTWFQPRRWYQFCGIPWVEPVGDVDPREEYDDENTRRRLRHQNR